VLRDLLYMPELAADRESIEVAKLKKTRFAARQKVKSKQ
jgi:hypothetical protein